MPVNKSKSSRRQSTQQKTEPRRQTVCQKIAAETGRTRWPFPTKASIIRQFSDLPALKQGGTRLLSKQEVIAHVNLTFPTIINFMTKGDFPYPVEVAGRPNWREGDVYTWLMSRPVRTYAIPKRRRDAEAVDDSAA